MKACIIGAPLTTWVVCVSPKTQALALAVDLRHMLCLFTLACFNETNAVMLPASQGFSVVQES